MDFEDTDGGTYSYECRCGESYVATREELRQGLDVVGCMGCSLFVRIVGLPEDIRPAASPSR